MKLDRKTLALIAPAMSVVGSVIGVVSALRSGPKKGGAVLSSLLGLVGSTLWLYNAYQDTLEPDVELDAV